MVTTFHSVDYLAVGWRSLPNSEYQWLDALMSLREEDLVVIHRKFSTDSFLTFKAPESNVINNTILNLIKLDDLNKLNAPRSKVFELSIYMTMFGFKFEAFRSDTYDCEETIKK